MKIKKLWISSLALAVCLGITTGYTYNYMNESHNTHNHSVAPNTKDLSEEFWNVDLIVKGKVVHEGESFKKDANVNSKIPFEMDVTPATIEINQVIYGNDPGKTITYLQHGNTAEKEIAESLVHQDEEVILILTKTTDGQYWSYNFDDGIWKVKNGKVKSKSSHVFLEKHNDSDETTFINEIKDAAKNKKKNASYK